MDSACFHKPMQRGVSILICCHNSALNIRETLNHLAVQEETDNIPWEVVLIDNASTDETISVALECWSEAPPAPLHVVQEPRLGLTFARMRGIHAATYPIVSFVDDDNWVCSDWIVRVVEIFTNHPEVGACGGPSREFIEHPPPSWFNNYKYAYAVGEQAEVTGYVPLKRGFLWGAGLSLRKSAIQNLLLNGFAFLSVDRQGKQLSGGGDNELCFALVLAGWQLWYDQNLSLQHHINISRLNWQYLLLLHKGFGASYIRLAPYRQAMTRFSESLPVKYYQQWQIQALSMCKQFFSNNKISVLRTLLRLAPEEDFMTLQAAILQGGLQELWKQQMLYDLSFSKIDTALWQSTNSK